MRAGKAVLSAVVITAAAALLAAQQQPPPQFRAEVNYVEVDARVLDPQGSPIHGLTQKDFVVFEDGVRQTLTNFSVVDIPVTTSAGETERSATVRPDVARNAQGEATRRTYLLVIDDASIEPSQTPIVRAFLRRFVERRVGPDDLVGMTTTGRDAAYENFTNDKPRLLAAVNRIAGQGEGSPTINQLNSLEARAAANGGKTSTGGGGSGGVNPEKEALRRQAQRNLVEIIRAMSVGAAASKAIVYVTEGLLFDTITNTEHLEIVGDLERVATAARRSNVPIYPVDPRGLSSGFEAAVEAPAIPLNNGDPALAVLNEVRQAQQGLRILADDSGGLPIVGANDIDGGLDRIVGMSSFYYVLGYYSTNSRRDGKYRRISVTVDRPGARVLNRHGYTAAVAGSSKSPSLAGPPKSSYELREALNAVLPTTGLPLEMTAAAFRQIGGRASVAVVLETSGSELTWKDDVLAGPLEMTAIAMEKRGGIKAGDVHRLELSTRSDTAARVRRFGYRWLARLDDLKPGRYQIRGAAANGPEKQGSVWYDIEIPDFAKNPLAMSDVVLASQVAALRPTLRPDKLLVDELPGPPTTLRQFPEGGTVAVYAEVYDNQLDRPHDLETSVVVTNEHGEIAFRTVDMHSSRELGESRGLARVKAGIPLVNFRPGDYTLTVDARQASNRAISVGRAVPFQVVQANRR